jgi:chitodextrinase
MSLTSGFTPGEPGFATPKAVVTGATSTTIAGLDPNTTYYFIAWAKDKAGNVGKNNVEKSAKTPQSPDTTPPSQPTGLTATAVSPSQINLSWNASTDNVGVIGYKVYRNGQVVASSRKSAAIAIAAITTTNYSDTGLTPNTQYCYQVSAYDGANPPNESAPSNQICIMTQVAPQPPDTTPPSVPTGLTATAVSSSQINLSWNASPESDVAGYKIYRKDKLPNPIQSVAGTSTSDTGLSSSTEYCYSVSAFDAVPNESALSNQACATTQSAPITPDTTPPTQPTGLTATAVSSNQINLKWISSADNVGVEGYNIYRDGVLILFKPGTFTFNIGLSPSTKYCYTVQAIDTSGNASAMSLPACATTFAAPPPLPDLSPTALYTTCTTPPCYGPYLFDIHNGGTAPASSTPSIPIYFIYDCEGYCVQECTTVSSIPAGGTATCSTGFMFSFLRYAISVDPYNTIPELNEANNIFCTENWNWIGCSTLNQSTVQMIIECSQGACIPSFCPSNCG